MSLLNLPTGQRSNLGMTQRSSCGRIRMTPQPVAPVIQATGANAGGSDLQVYGTTQIPSQWVDSSGNVLTFPDLASATVAFVNSCLPLGFEYSETVAAWASAGHAPGTSPGGPAVGFIGGVPDVDHGGNGWEIYLETRVGNPVGGTSLAVGEFSFQNINPWTVPYWVFRWQAGNYAAEYPGGYVVDFTTLAPYWRYTLTLLSSGTIGTNEIIGANAAINGFAFDLPFPDSDPSTLQVIGGQMVCIDVIFAYIAQWPTATLADALQDLQLQLGEVYSS